MVMYSLPPPPSSKSAEGWTIYETVSVVSAMLSGLVLTVLTFCWWWLRHRRKLRREAERRQAYLEGGSTASNRSASTKVRELTPPRFFSGALKKGEPTRSRRT